MGLGTRGTTPFRTSLPESHLPCAVLVVRGGAGNRRAPGRVALPPASTPAGCLSWASSPPDARAGPHPRREPSPVPSCPPLPLALPRAISIHPFSSPPKHFGISRKVSTEPGGWRGRGGGCPAQPWPFCRVLNLLSRCPPAPRTAQSLKQTGLFLVHSRDQRHTGPARATVEGPQSPASDRSVDTTTRHWVLSMRRRERQGPQAQEQLLSCRPQISADPQTWQGGLSSSCSPSQATVSVHRLLQNFLLPLHLCPLTPGASGATVPFC